MEILFKDIRYGIHSLLKQPSFAMTAVVTLALGIGANTAIFSVVSGVLLRPLPFKDSDRFNQFVEQAAFWCEADRPANLSHRGVGIDDYSVSLVVPARAAGYESRSDGGVEVRVIGGS